MTTTAISPLDRLRSVDVERVCRSLAQRDGTLDLLACADTWAGPSNYGGRIVATQGGWIDIFDDPAHEVRWATVYDWIVDRWANPHAGARRVLAACAL